MSSWLAATTIGIFPVLYAGASLFSTVDIGYRHLLPVLPFLYIAIGSITEKTFEVYVSSRRLLEQETSKVSAWTLPSVAPRVVLAGLLLWLAVGTLATLPYPLTFFNEIAGGPANGYRALVDSNLDWGQNLWDLKAWMAAHGISHVAYAHYSPARPDTYGIEADWLPPDPRAVSFDPWHPAPGLYAIGATVLQGPYAPDLNTFAWFRDRTPVAKLGNALFLYQVEDDRRPPGRSFARRLSAPMTIRRRVGVPELRVVQPACDQAFVIPASETPGLIVLPPDLPTPDVGDPLLTLRNADGDTQAIVRSVSADDVRPEAPAPVGDTLIGPLTFLGTTSRSLRSRDARRAADPNLLAGGRPPRAPALADGAPRRPGWATLAVGDGMGFPIDQWQVGDVIVQTHRFEPAGGPPQGEAISLQIGGYWLDTLERWPTTGGGDSITVALKSEP